MKTYFSRRVLVCSSALACIATPVLAQAQPSSAVPDNPITEAEDAFGSAVGSESLGIYAPGSVRGFSPLDAGNVRIDGVYVDRQAEFTSRLVAGNRVKVGPSTIAEAFPAPSGIADFRLRVPGDIQSLLSSAQIDGFGAWFAESDATLPLDADGSGLIAGAGFYANRSADQREAQVLSLAVSGRWVAEDLSVAPFWSRIAIRNEEAPPLFIGSGLNLPPEIDRRTFVGQHWALSDKTRINLGMIVRAEPMPGLAVRGGVFRSSEHVPIGASLLLFAPAPDTLIGNRSAIAFSSRFASSTSGELLAIRRFGNPTVRHEFTIAARFRTLDRRFGGADTEILAPATFGSTDVVDRPNFSTGPLNRDAIRQVNLGVGYRLSWVDRFEFNLGAQRAYYRKRFARAGHDPSERTDTPWLFNAAASVRATPVLRVYASISRGLEEAPVAPEFAANRDEAPPAILTRQIDGGISLSLPGNLNAVLGAFEITKPYFAVDADNVFRDLGTVRHRGIEASVTASPMTGLSFVLGGYVLEASVSGISALAQNPSPIGTPDHALQASVDWRPGGASPWSFDATLTRTGRQAANLDNSVMVPSRVELDLELRYRFELADVPWQLRVQASNVTDAFAWTVAGQNAFRPLTPRRVIVRLTAEL
jgi:iron complex outermembrane recepter protein